MFFARHKASDTALASPEYLECRQDDAPLVKRDSGTPVWLFRDETTGDRQLGEWLEGKEYVRDDFEIEPVAYLVESV